MVGQINVVREKNMIINRRKFITCAAGGVTLGTMATSPLANLSLAMGRNTKIRAIAFDGFPIFDPRSIFGLTKTLFPAQGSALGKLWFTKIFAYTWVRTTGERYRNFYAVIEDALIFSAKRLKLDLTSEKRKQLMAAWLELKIWPDVKPALQQFKEQNIRLGFLSNFTEHMLRINAGNSGIEDAFEFYLSTDRVQAFKPSPKAYQMGVEAFGLPKENIAFAAFAGWDAVGASWFGYPAVWVNRIGAPMENLNADLAAAGKDISALTGFVRQAADSTERLGSL